jgi:hypothetical protein
MPIHPNVPRCLHIKINGIQCGSPRLRDGQLCFFHNRMRRINVGHQIPLIEDANALQMAIMEILRGVSDESMDLKKATTMLYGLQIAQSNLRHLHLAPDWEEIVQEDPSEGAIMLRLKELSARQAPASERQLAMKEYARGYVCELESNGTEP